MGGLSSCWWAGLSQAMALNKMVTGETILVYKSLSRSELWGQPKRTTGRNKSLKWGPQHKTRGHREETRWELGHNCKKTFPLNEGKETRQ